MDNKQELEEGQRPAEFSYTDKLIYEKMELDEKIRKLEEFNSLEDFRALPVSEKSLLRIQINAMNTYSVCLTERLGDSWDGTIK